MAGGVIVLGTPALLLAVLVGEAVYAARSDLPAAPAPDGVDGCIACTAGGATPLRMLWLGDSTADGDGASGPDGTVVRQVARLLAEPVEVRDLAVSGATVSDVLEAQVSQVADFRPDVVLISIGANDVTHLTRRPMFRSTYRQVLDRLPAGVKVVLLGPPDMGSPPRLAQPLRSVAGLRGRSLEADVRHLAAERHLLYVDIAGATGTSFRHDHRLFASDRYHPDDDGYALWAKAVVAVYRG